MVIRCTGYASGVNKVTTTFVCDGETMSYRVISVWNHLFDIAVRVPSLRIATKA